MVKYINTLSHHGCVQIKNKIYLIQFYILLYIIFILYTLISGISA